MSGAIAATTIAAISAAAAVGSTVYGVVSGQQQNANQKKALAQQNAAQKTAEAQTLSNQRRSEVAQNAVNRQTPDIAAILSRAAGVAKGGIGSTMLTGAGGVDAGSLTLGKSSLLGS